MTPQRSPWSQMKIPMSRSSEDVVQTPGEVSVQSEGFDLSTEFCRMGFLPSPYQLYVTGLPASPLAG